MMLQSADVEGCVVPEHTNESKRATVYQTVGSAHRLMLKRLPVKRPAEFRPAVLFGSWSSHLVNPKRPLNGTRDFAL